MAPNADFDTFDENDETVMNSFLLSNIAPQHHGFNAGKIFRESFFFQHAASLIMSLNEFLLAKQQCGPKS